MIPKTLPLLCLALLGGCEPAAPAPMTTPPPPGRFGLVRAAVTTQTISGRTFSQSHASAAFIDTSDSGGGRSCERRAAGACLLYRCTPGAGSAQLPNAGPIAVGAGADGVTLSVRGDGSYNLYSHSSVAVWHGGQTLPVSAPGVPGLVPAFSTEVVMPADSFGLTVPEISPVLSLTIDRGRDLTLTYGGTQGPVELLLVQDLLSGAGGYLLCSFPAGQTGATVPADLLGALQPTKGTDHTALFLVGPAFERTVMAGDWTVDVAAIGIGSTALATLQ